MAFEEEFFLQNVPTQMQIALARCVIAGCEAARVGAKEHPKEWQKDATYMLRRLYVEAKLYDMVLPKGFSARTVETNSTTYTQIESDQVVITAITRNRNVGSVPKMKYRDTLAESAQCLLFRQPQLNDPDVQKKLYALLVYGGPLKASRAEQCRIVFPLPDGKFAPGDIDLLGRHEAVLFPKPVEQEKRKPRLRIVKKSQEI